jgi:hypothetical protein
MKRLVQGTAIAAVAGALGIAIAVHGIGPAIVGADTSTATATTACPAPQGNQAAFRPPARAGGTIAAISGTTLTLTQQDNSTVTITTDANTHFDRTVASSLGTIAVGDFVMAQGTTSGTTFAAITVMDDGARTQPQGGNTPGGNGPGAPGGDPRGGPFGPGGPGGNGQPPTQANGTSPTLPAGCAPAQGQQPRQGQRPSQGQQGQQPPRPDGADDGSMVVGSVQQVNGTTLTMTTFDGTTLTVTTDSNTTVAARQQGTFADLQVGDQVTAMAKPQSGNTGGDSTTFTAAMISDRTPH